MLWAVTRLTWCLGSAFIVESIIFGLADLHARVNDAVRVRDARPAMEDAPPHAELPIRELSWPLLDWGAANGGTNAECVYQGARGLWAHLSHQP